jgi:hypothetical protein
MLGKMEASNLSTRSPETEDKQLQNKISLDVIYTELYNEMRRYRDQHFSLFQWYTTLSVAAIAAIAGLGQLRDSHQLLQQIRPWLSIILIVGGAFVSYWGWYANKRYIQLRKQIEILEPVWEKLWSEPPSKLQPHHGLLIVTVVMTITILAFIWGF